MTSAPIRRRRSLICPAIRRADGWSACFGDAGARLMHLLRLHGELKVNTSCGASNFSFGLPNRRGLAASFLPMMIGAGLTSAIMNPLHSRRFSGPTW
jgi:hypothetical protein